nr:type I inositol 1,4,5-trisphosphate 5-phosphatase 12 [Ipomoea batatas]
MRDVRVDIIPGLVKEQALQFNLCEREITFTMALPTRSQNETVAYPQSIPGSQKGASMNLMPGDGFEGNAIMDKQGKKDQSRSSCQHSSLKTPQQCSSTRNRSNFTPLLNFEVSFAMEAPRKSRTAFAAADSRRYKTINTMRVSHLLKASLEFNLQDVDEMMNYCSSRMWMNYCSGMD